jgi:hypothetical protein
LRILLEARCDLAEQQPQPGQLFRIMRAAVTGQTVSPPLFGAWRSLDDKS